jgi:hypothetical protein
MLEPEMEVDAWIAAKRKAAKEKYNKNREKKYRSRLEITNALGTIIEPNWEQLVLELRSAGVPATYISESLGLSPGTLAAWVSRKEMNRRMGWKVGFAILKLHAVYCNGVNTRKA